MKTSGAAGVHTMMKQIITPVLCSLFLLTVLGSSALAQLPPPVSPWMGMFDQQRSPLGNYLSNVKPQQDMMRAYATQQSQMQAQQRALQALGSGSSGGGSGSRDLATISGGGGGAGFPTVLAPPREIPSVQRNPAGFNQYLHYYPPNAMPQRQVPNFSSAGRRR